MGCFGDEEGIILCIFELVCLILHGKEVIGILKHVIYLPRLFMVEELLLPFGFEF